MQFDAIPFDSLNRTTFNFFSVHSTCCGNEILSVMGSRYDLERFGCQPVFDPSEADLLLVMAAINDKLASEVREIYQKMRSPKWVISLGSCANSGGLFLRDTEGCVLAGLNQLIPVDLYIPGCPPRPEAILNGLIQLSIERRKPLAGQAVRQVLHARF